MQTSMPEASHSGKGNTPLPNEPLAIRVTVPTQENVALRALIRSAIPILKNPEAYGKDARLQLARTLTQALRGEPHNAEDDEPDWDGPIFTDVEAPPEEADALDCCCSCDGSEWILE